MVIILNTFSGCSRSLWREQQSSASLESLTDSHKVTAWVSWGLSFFSIFFLNSLWTHHTHHKYSAPRFNFWFIRFLTLLFQVWLNALSQLLHPPMQSSLVCPDQAAHTALLCFSVLALIPQCEENANAILRIEWTCFAAILHSVLGFHNPGIIYCSEIQCMSLVTKRHIFSEHYGGSFGYFVKGATQ